MESHKKAAHLTEATDQSYLQIGAVMRDENHSSITSRKLVRDLVKTVNPCRVNMSLTTFIYKWNQL